MLVTEEMSRDELIALVGRQAGQITAPPASNQAERDLRPSAVQPNASERLTSENRTKERYTIRRVLSTAAKHDLTMMTVRGDALTDRLWMPEIPVPTSLPALTQTRPDTTTPRSSHNATTPNICVLGLNVHMAGSSIFTVGSPNLHGRILGMRFGRWRLWLWMGLLLLVGAATIVIVVLLFRGISAELIGTLIAVVTTAAEIVRRLWKRARPAGAARLSLERAADALAEQLRRQWKRAAAERGLTPAPIPVRWRWSSRPVTGSPAEAVGGGEVPLLPGMAVVTAEDLRSGELEDLLGLYGGLGSGRLIVLGEPGAGKSGAGILLLLGALAHRATVPAEDRARVPVPVLVSPRGWDPDAEPFAEWLADRLARDYPLLRAPEYGEDVAMRLIADDRLAVILDGLDEMPEVLRPVALDALDAQVTFRLVVLTRTKELEAAVRHGHLLKGAAALELLPIGPSQAGESLTRYLIDPPPSSWQHLIDHLREHPEGVLAQALTTPLTLTLVRDTYGPEEGVDELIDGSRFPTREAIDDHLLDRVLTVAYARHPGRPAPPYAVDQARGWLGQVAHRMKEERARDLAWWQVPRWVPAWPRAVATVAVMVLASALLFGVLVVLAVYLPRLSAFRASSLPKLALFGQMFGCASMFGPGLLLTSPPSGRALSRRERLQWRKREILALFLFGLVGGIGIGLTQGFRGGLVSSFVIGLGFVLSGGPPQQLGWLRWGRTDTRTNLRTGLALGLVVGLVVGLGHGLGYGPRQGLVCGFVVGIGYMLVIVVGGRPSHQRSQLRESRIDTPTILLIGLIIAIVTTSSYGIAYVLVVIFAGRSPLQRSWLRWSRTTTPTTLLTGLLTGLVFGFVFGGVYEGVYGGSYGFKLGLVDGLVFGLVYGLPLGLRQPPTEAISPLDPPSLWRRERQFGLVAGFAAGIVLGPVFAFGEGLINVFSHVIGFGPVGGGSIVSGLVIGLVTGLGSGLMSSTTWATRLASVQLRWRGETPVRLLRFLDDAHERQVLRTVGPTYQFRHARLQDRLVGARDKLGEAS